MGSESKKTVSRHTTETETGTHAFEIVGYTLKKGIGVGNFIRSGTFVVGCYDWAIRFYPDGFNEASKEYVSIYLELMGKNARARASYSLSLVNQAAGFPLCVCPESTVLVFNWDGGRFSPSTRIARRSDLEYEPAGYIVDNCLTIECSVTVVKGSYVSDTSGVVKIQVPPSELSEHFGKLLLGKLLLEEEDADVTFIVEGETFPAHKIVLAARSPVFKAQLYGQMKERRANCITVEDVQPEVFKALLHFINTDSLSEYEWDDLDSDEYTEIVKHLLVAADRYAMERLKLMCASILVDHLDVETVANTLALADQHNCDGLKDVCIEFMASSEMDDVVASQGYANLKRSCPSVLVDVLEKTRRYRKT